MLKYLLLLAMMLPSGGCAMYALGSGQVVVTDTPQAADPGRQQDDDAGDGYARHHRHDDREDE